MVYNTQNYWGFGLLPSSGILENTKFRKLDLRTETDPVSETSCSLEYQTMEKVSKSSNSVRICMVWTSHHFRYVESIT
jgi:hypothetical protein